MAELDGYAALEPGELGFERILYSKGGGRATIAFNRPEVLNAFDFRTLRELTRAVEDASWDDDVRVIVLTGAGDRAFSTGADLREQARIAERPRDYWKWMGQFIDAHDELRDCGKPTLARVDGLCVGGGNEFHMACDLSIASERSIFRHVGLQHGSVPAGGATQWLPVLVGDRRAREMIMLCEDIPAARALEWGLVNKVVPREELDEAVDDWVAKLAARLPEATRYAKHQLNFWRDLSWHMTIGHARDWLTLHAGDVETTEAVRAFLEKRPPDLERIRRGS
jgi:enoyl-CoA hydratase/carnithine racemase